MTTTIKSNKKNQNRNGQSGKANSRKKTSDTAPMLTNGIPANVSIGLIDYSPINYRKYYSEKDLLDFAEELRLHGIIHSVTVREVVAGRYELVVGERRLRGAAIAGIEDIPVIIRQLTDEQVREIQLAENLQRENPHPMNEAQGIGDMMNVYKSIEEIALRLGKSKQFVYSRLRLLSLVEPIREMFIENVLNIQEAFEIAALSRESQEDFFSQYCKDWREHEKFSIGNLRWVLTNYKYDLNQAPFNTEDETLVPEAGACTNCPSNSATLNTLFPELAKNAQCSNKQCFKQKCGAYFNLLLVNEVTDYKPQGIIFYRSPSELMVAALNDLPVLAEVPQYPKSAVTLWDAPEMPDRTDFDFGEDEEETDEDGKPIDYTGYYAMMAEYEQDLEDYQNAIASGELMRGLLVSDGQIERTYYTLYKEEPQVKTNAKTVSDAMKAGVATEQMLRSEIDRLNTREKRAKEIDRDKVQLAVHTAFSEQLADAVCPSLTSSDMAAARYLIYLSLGWSEKSKFEKALIPARENEEISGQEHFFQVFSNMSEQDFSYLIRLALTGKSEGKFPNQTGYFVYKVAESAGIDVAAIEAAQAAKVTEREERLSERVGHLEYKLKRLKGVAKSTQAEENTEADQQHAA